MNTTTEISEDRLVNPVNSNLDHLMKCKICFNILVNPHDCDQCGNTFCYNCINSLVQNNKPCPFKCENYSIKPSSLVITTFLSNLKFYCLNKENGCDKQLDYLQVLSHDKECPFSYSICPNVKCQKSVKRQLMEYHIKKECEFSLFKCDNCDMKFIRNNYLDHIKNCKVISDIFDIKNPIIDTCGSADDLNFSLNTKEVSMSSFLKIILFQMAKSNLETNKKLDSLCEEITNIKEDMSKNHISNNLFYENMNNEIINLAEKVSNIETGMTCTQSIKKILEDNLKETALLKDNIYISQKDEIIKSSNSSSNNSIFINSNNQSGINPSTLPSAQTSKPPSTNSSINTIPSVANLKLTKQNTINESNVKKVALRSTYKPNDTRSPQNRSPVNQRSPNSKNFNTNFNSETESFGNKTNNITLIKTMMKNQENIIERLAKILSKLEIVDSKIISDNKRREENLKFYLKEEILDELKALILETSLDNSNVIMNKVEELMKK